jgi:putative transposase
LDVEETPVTIETMAKKEPETTPASAVVDQKVVAELVARAGAEGVSLTGEGGLLAQLTKLVLEASLEGELDAHLGYAKHDPAGRDGGNSRNGRRAKTVVTQVGPVEVEVPRDRGTARAASSRRSCASARGAWTVWTGSFCRCPRKG